jgi:hypothetical protein
MSHMRASFRHPRYLLAHPETLSRGRSDISLTLHSSCGVTICSPPSPRPHFLRCSVAAFLCPSDGAVVYTRSAVWAHPSTRFGLQRPCRVLSRFTSGTSLVRACVSSANRIFPHPCLRTLHLSRLSLSTVPCCMKTGDSPKKRKKLCSLLTRSLPYLVA